MLKFLSSIGRKNYMFLDKAVRENIGFDEFYNAILSKNPEYNYYEASIDYHKMQFYNRIWGTAEEVGYNEAYGRDYFAEAYKPTARRYMGVFHIKGYNPKSGQWEERYITVGSDELIEKREWYDNVTDALEQGQENGSNPLENVEIEFSRGYRGW